MATECIGLMLEKRHCGYRASVYVEKARGDRASVYVEKARGYGIRARASPSPLALRTGSHVRSGMVSGKEGKRTPQVTKINRED